jgi:hypothetical protein
MIPCWSCGAQNEVCFDTSNALNGLIQKNIKIENNNPGQYQERLEN